jgi:signal transduction histidine kinase
MRDYAGDINKDAQRLNRMINEMLDLDRLESGRMALELTKVDLNAVITEVAGGVLPGAADHPILLRLDAGLGPVTGDRDKLTQVVVNLLSNAVKYSPGGGEIVVTTRAEGPNAHVLVRDHGMGIPADGLEQVFERFARLESDATRFIQGTGLGLPIVRQIVTLHGGRVWAESTAGEGSVFQFTIPLATPAGV